MTIHTVRVYQTSFPYEDDEQIDLLELHWGPFTCSERVLLDAWNEFYGKAFANGQTPQSFRFEWINETTAEVVLNKTAFPGPSEVFTLMLDES